MNKLNRDCFIGHDKIILQILVNIQIFHIVAGNSSSALPANKREYLYLHNYEINVCLNEINMCYNEITLRFNEITV